MSEGTRRPAEGLGKYFHFDNVFFDDPVKCGFLDLYQMGELCCEPGFRIEEHPQEVYEITYVISGRGYSYVDGEKIRLNEGDVMVNAMGHRHALEADKSSIFRYTYLGFRFNGEAAGGDYEALKAYYSSVPYHLTKDCNSLLLPFMRCMDEFYSQRAYADTMVRNYCEQIVVLTTRDSLERRETQPAREFRPGAVSSAVYSVVRYVEDNIETLGSIRDIARELGYSYTYLSAFFKEKTGTTLQQYIRYKKIERAAQLLKYGNLSVSQTGAALCYDSLSAFSKAFRRVMGVSPTRYLALENTRPLTNGTEADGGG